MGIKGGNLKYSSSQVADYLQNGILKGAQLARQTRQRKFYLLLSGISLYHVCRENSQKKIVMSKHESKSLLSILFLTNIIDAPLILEESAVEEC